ncbi:MAG: acyl carrier protein [Desulfovibrionaceae bacterium]
MKVTREQVLKLFLDAGVEKEIVDGLKPGILLTKQGLDSVDYPSILVTIEESLGITIDETEACELKTLEDFETRLSK